MLAAAIGISPSCGSLDFAQQVFRVQAGLRDQQLRELVTVYGARPLDGDVLSRLPQ
jgi:hypothetical protein